MNFVCRRPPDAGDQLIPETQAGLNTLTPGEFSTIISFSVLAWQPTDMKSGKLNNLSHAIIFSYLATHFGINDDNEKMRLKDKVFLPKKANYFTTWPSGLRKASPVQRKDNQSWIRSNACSLQVPITGTIGASSSLLLLVQWLPPSCAEEEMGFSPTEYLHCPHPLSSDRAAQAGQKSAKLFFPPEICQQFEIHLLT